MKHQALFSSKGSIPGLATYFRFRSGHLLSFLLQLIQEGHLSVTGVSMCMQYWLTA